MTDEELRPCPFCQSTSVHTFSCVKDNGESKLGVQCGECGAEISRWFPWVADDERQKSLLEAVARWNNRATAIHGMDGDLLGRLRATWCGHHGMDELHPVNLDGDEAADRIEALTAENERLREALEAHEKHMTAGQTLAVKYLVPEVDPDSIGKDDFINRIIEHFDGPDQRAVQAKAHAALGKQP